MTQRTGVKAATIVKLSVVIPCFNEEQGLETCIRGLLEPLPAGQAGLAVAQERGNVASSVRDSDNLAIDDEVGAYRPEQERAGPRQVSAGVPGVGERREVIEILVEFVHESVGGIRVTTWPGTCVTPSAGPLRSRRRPSHLRSQPATAQGTRAKALSRYGPDRQTECNRQTESMKRGFDPRTADLPARYRPDGGLAPPRSCR